MKYFKYVSNKQENANFVEMFIYNEIGFDGVDGAQFAHELRYLAQFLEPKPKEIKIRINSVGGSVIDAFSIFSAIYNTNQAGEVEVNTYNDGVAASAAGFILMAGKNIYAKDYSRLMLHGVSFLNEDGTENTSVSDNDKQALTVFKDMIKQVFINNTSVDEGQLEDLLSNNKDNWFSAKEAAIAGFIQEKNIENTGLKLDLPAKHNALIVANMAQKIIKNNSTNLKPLQMKTVINLLKLQEGASEEVIANAVNAALTKAKDSSDALLLAENKITEKDATILELQTKVKAANKATAISFVENAIKEGKFTPKDETEKDALVAQAEANPEGFKTMVNMMPTKAANILDQTKKGGEGVETLIGRIANRSLREIEKAEPSLLVELKNNAKGEFVKLWNAQYGTEKTEADFK